RHQNEWQIQSALLEQFQRFQGVELAERKVRENDLGFELLQSIDELLFGIHTTRDKANAAFPEFALDEFRIRGDILLQQDANLLLFPGRCAGRSVLSPFPFADKHLVFWNNHL